MNNRKIKYGKSVSAVVFFIFIFFMIVHTSSVTAYAVSVNTMDKADFNKTIAYMVTTITAFALLAGYCGLTKKKNVNFILLFTSVFVINLGYTFGSASKTLEEALLANKISYVGAVFLPLFMLLIILEECRFSPGRHLIGALVFVSSCIFFLTMTPGYTTWYYESVELIFVNGGAKLVKNYGPMHKLYYVYLILYFSFMTASIILAVLKKKHSSIKIPLTLLSLVFGNIMIWFIEQRIYFSFEFLSISYLITEVFLLALANMMYMQLAVPCRNCTEISNKDTAKTINDDSSESFVPDIQEIIKAWPATAQLTTRETEVFRELIMNRKRKDIAEHLCVSENTVKKHTTNIFTKLGVSSRAEIMNILLKIK